MKGQYRASHTAVSVLDGRHIVVDRYVFSGSGPEHHVAACTSGVGALLEEALRGLELNWQNSRGPVKDLPQGPADGFAPGPAREGLRRGIHERDAAALVRGDDGLCGAFDGRGRLPLPSLPGMQAQSGFNVQVELSRRCRLEHVTDRLAVQGAALQRLTGIAVEIQHRGVQRLAQVPRRVDAVRFSGQFQVDQDQIRRPFRRRHRVLSGQDRSARVSRGLQLFFQARGHGLLVLHDEDSCRCHGALRCG